MLLLLLSNVDMSTETEESALCCVSVTEFEFGASSSSSSINRNLETSNGLLSVEWACSDSVVDEVSWSSLHDSSSNV